MLATHTFEEPGLYVITLRAWTEAGDEDTAYLEIRAAGQTPTAVISADTYAGPAPLTVYFDGSGSHAPDDVIRDYIWDFGDSSQVSEQTRPVHTYRIAGTYTVTLTVRTAGGAEGQTTAVITVGTGGGVSLQFDGSQFATLPLDSTATLSDWTFETWFKSTTAGGTIVSAGGGALSLQLLPGSNLIRFQIAGQQFEASLTNLAGSWQHVALVHQSGNQATLMVEGIEVYTVAARDNIEVSQLTLGAGFAGKLAEVRLWQAARTRTQIETNRGSRLYSAIGGLLGYWQLDEGSGQTLYNGGASAVSGTLGSSTAAEASDPAWSSDGPPLQ